MLYRLRNSQSFGLPVGWAYYPYCLPQAGMRQVDPNCRKAQVEPLKLKPATPAETGGIRAFLAEVHEKGRPLLWLFSAIVTGFLIGLGGPYWFDLAMSLSRLRDFLKTGKDKAQEETPRAPDPAALVDAFLVKMDQNANLKAEDKHDCHGRRGW
jgi:hypothetical protein